MEILNSFRSGSVFACSNTRPRGREARLISAVLAALSLATTMYCATAHASPGTVSASVNHRAGPGTSYAVVQVIPVGGSIDIQECAEKWCRVSHAGTSGWVWRSYVQERPSFDVGVSDHGSDTSGPAFRFRNSGPMLTYGVDNQILMGDPAPDEWPWYRRPDLSGDRDRAFH